MFDKLKAVIVGAAGILALVPGASLMTGALELPIEFNDALGYMAAVVGPIVFFVVFLARQPLLRLRAGVLNVLIVTSALCGLALGYWTNEYAQKNTGEYPYIDHNGKEQIARYIVPESYSPELARRLDRDGGNLDNTLKRNREGTLDLLHKDSGPVRLKMVLGFLGAQALLIFAFLCAAWAVAQAATKEEKGQAKLR